MKVVVPLLALLLCATLPARAASLADASGLRVEVTAAPLRWTVSTPQGVVASGPLVEAWAGEVKVSFQARVTRSEPDVLEVALHGGGLDGAATVRLLQGRVVPALHLRGSAPRLRVDFPVLTVAGDGLWYCIPRAGAVINHIPIAVREPRGGRLPLQFMDAWGPRGGLALLTTERAPRGFAYRLRKDREGVTMAVEHDVLSLPFTAVPARLVPHAGDWHAAFDAYRGWLDTWLRPSAPLKGWFRNAFHLRQQHLRLAGTPYLRDGRLRLKDALAEERRAFGGIDLLHLFDWGASATHGRVGDYDAWDEIGGAPAFRGAVADAGVPVSLYLEGYLVDLSARLAGRARPWQLRDAAGQPASPFPPSMAMCPAVPAWRAYLADVYRRARAQSGAAAFYCDEVGFADPLRICHAPDHGHPVPSTPLSGEYALLRALREAVGPDAVLYTEETPADVAAVFVDGSFTYAVASASDAWSPSHVNLTRFALPHLKTFEIVECDRPIGDRIEAVRRIFFNGEGIWLAGPSRDWYSPRVLAYIRRMHAVMRAHADCFASLRPRPLVATAAPGVYANRFPGRERTLWTLYNPGPRTSAGVVLRVPHVPGSTWRDAWNDRPLTPRVSGGTAEVALPLDAGATACVVRVDPRPRSW